MKKTRKKVGDFAKFIHNGFLCEGVIVKKTELGYIVVGDFAGLELFNAGVRCGDEIWHSQFIK